ncbi:MAG: hypothetical protein HRU36_05790 [Rickettsiales bacterium]|nr:hypothetical protein [Rickettsiales bacterium]
MFDTIIRTSYLGSQYLNNQDIKHPVVKTALKGLKKVTFLNQLVPTVKGYLKKLQKQHMDSFSDEEIDLSVFMVGNVYLSFLQDNTIPFACRK